MSSRLARPLTASELAVSKVGDLFALAQADLEIDHEAGGGQGLYFRDTLYLERIALRVAGARPRPAGPSATHPHRQLARLRAGRLTVVRERELGWPVKERLRVENPARRARRVLVELDLGFSFESTYAVRGFQGGPAPRPVAAAWRAGELWLERAGADGHGRRMRIACDPAPEVAELPMRWWLEVPPRGAAGIEVNYWIEESAAAVTWRPVARHRRPSRGPRVQTDNPDFDRVLARGFADLDLLTSGPPVAIHLQAGLPWYAALFGRDSLIGALQALPYRPELARGTLLALAARQGAMSDGRRFEEPGKILHALREEEWTGAGRIPHSPSYGSVDATPLFAIVLAAYVRWTADLELARRLAGPLERALDWILGPGDHDGDGFLDYDAGGGPGAVENQGWKDSGDCITHRDGSLAQPPVALVEVQAYAYRALRDSAWLLRQMQEGERAARLEAAAAGLRERFRAAFWMPRRRFPAVALDGRGRRAETVTSNPGHALWAGILDAADAAHVIRRLLGRRLFSGWGIRTLAAGEAAYAPDAYHRGSVWPHDNQLAMEGMRRYGRPQEAALVFTAIYEAARGFPGGRLPELFSGRPRSRRRAPLPYANTCSPQAWAAGTLPAMLATALGLDADGLSGRLVVRNPHLPPFLGEVCVSGLRVGSGTASLCWRRGPAGGTSLEVLPGTRGVEIEASGLPVSP